TMWSWAFVAFAACCSFCAWWTYRARQSAPHNAPVLTDGGALPAADQPPGTWLRIAWIGLPALASVMFLAVTNEACQYVATVPLLWIIPLSLYLISFIVAFDHPRWYVRPICAGGAIVLMVYLANFRGFCGQLSMLLNRLLSRSAADEFDLETKTLNWILYF